MSTRKTLLDSTSGYDKLMQTCTGFDFALYFISFRHKIMPQILCLVKTYSR